MIRESSTMLPGQGSMLVAPLGLGLVFHWVTRSGLTAGGRRTLPGVCTKCMWVMLDGDAIGTIVPFMSIPIMASSAGTDHRTRSRSIAGSSAVRWSVTPHAAAMRDPRSITTIAMTITTIIMTPATVMITTGTRLNRTSSVVSSKPSVNTPLAAWFLLITNDLQLVTELTRL